jgi:tRNA(Ile)-lysidine synthase
MAAIPAASEYWVAFSGGLDSSVLLYLAKAFLSAMPGLLRAIHVNHQLSDQADRWQAHSEAVAGSLGIPLAVEVVEVVADGQGIESAARKARYAAFARHVPANAVLLQAHHLNDLAETLLYRMLRGAGVTGLSGIPRQRQVSLGAEKASGREGFYQIYRPLLDVPRQQLEQLAAAMNISWVDDPSNDNTDFDRNYLRHQVMPLLQSRWPGALEAIGQTARNCIQADALGQILAQKDLQDVKAGAALDIQRLQQLTADQQRNLVRFWLTERGLGFPGRKQFERIWSELISARQDAQPSIRWSGGELRRHRHCLYGLSRDAEPASYSGPIRPGDRLQSAAGVLSVLDAKALANMEISGQSLPDQGKGWIGKIVLPCGQGLSVRPRQGGEVIRIANRGAKKLKKLFQEADIPEWLRDHYPLVYAGDVLIAVPGIAMAQCISHNLCSNDAASGGELIILKFD